MCSRSSSPSRLRSVYCTVLLFLFFLFLFIFVVSVLNRNVKLNSSVSVHNILGQNLPFDLHLHLRPRLTSEQLIISLAPCNRNRSLFLSLVHLLVPAPSPIPHFILPSGYQVVCKSHFRSRKRRRKEKRREKYIS